MILSAHQSHYLPWLGYLDKIDRSDIFVVLDDVQYEKNGWQNRNRILSAKGPQWLTVPVHAHLSQRLLDIAISDNVSWEKDHAKTLELNYRKSPHFSFLWDALEEIYEKKWRSLVELNETSLAVLLEKFGLAGKRQVRSSALGIKSEATTRLVEICKSFKADTYLSGEGAKAYLDLSLFEKAGIRVAFQEFRHPVYSQIHGEDFVEGLSAVDLLFNHGEDALEILRGMRK